MWCIFLVYSLERHNHVSTGHTGGHHSRILEELVDPDHHAHQPQQRAEEENLPIASALTERSVEQSWRRTLFRGACPADR